jgi:DsbC/DsbD-like thiol-disulfide interchange protein
VTTYGYKGSASLKAEAAVGDAFAADELVVEARVEWLACSDDACVPGRAELRTVLKTKPNKKENQP